VDGKCALQLQKCPRGEVNCNGKCITVSNDANNCGTCGTVCPSGYTCVNGKCQLIKPGN
jgi:hypothetical protein